LLKINLAICLQSVVLGEHVRVAVIKCESENSATVCTLTVPVPSLDQGGGQH